MSSYPDTSLLCALYVPQSSSPQAIEWMEQQKLAVELTSLLLFEFRQSIRFQAFWHRKDRTQGFSQKIAAAALAALDSDIIAGIFKVVPADRADVHPLAEQLSSQQTKS